MDAALQQFIDQVTPAKRKRDAETLLDLFARVTEQVPKLWPGNIIGFGSYHYKYASGREGDAPAAGFSPRKAATTIYLLNGVDADPGTLERIGPYRAGVGCVYLTDLDKNNLAALEDLIRSSYRTLTAGTFPGRAHDATTPDAPAPRTNPRPGADGGGF